MGTQCTLAFGKLCGAKPSSFFFSKKIMGFTFFLLNLLGYLKVLREFCLWEFGKDIMLTCAVEN